MWAKVRYHNQNNLPTALAKHKKSSANLQSDNAENLGLILHLMNAERKKRMLNPTFTTKRFKKTEKY